MDIGKKVVWAEGVFLAQQHFQQWDQSLQGQFHQIHKWLFLKRSGLLELEIDTIELEEGTFNIQKLLYLMPNGLWLQYGNNTSQPLSLKVDNQLQEIFLVIPKGECVSGISGYPKTIKDSAPWVAEYVQCLDKYDQNNEREVLFARRQLFLSSKVNVTDNHTYIKIAEVKQKSDGSFILTDYIPEFVYIGSSKLLSDLLKKICSKLSKKTRILKEQYTCVNLLNRRGEQPLNYSVFIISILTKYYAKLVVLGDGTELTTRQFYQILSAFRLELAALQTTALEDIPYNKKNIADTFLNMEKEIFELIKQVEPQRTQNISVQKVGENLFHFDGIVENHVKGKHLYLEVSNASSSEDEWFRTFEINTKLGPASKIYEICASAILGIKLRYVSRLPSSITSKPSCEYFKIENNGDFWQQVLIENKLAIFTSKMHKDIQIKLIVVEQ